MRSSRVEAVRRKEDLSYMLVQVGGVRSSRMADKIEHLQRRQRGCRGDSEQNIS